MFFKENCYCLGHIARLHSFKGEVLVHLDVDDPQDYKKLESVFVEIDGKLIPFFLEHIHLRKKQSAVVKFEDIDSEERAQLLVKCRLYLPKEAMPEADTKKVQRHQIEGYAVNDKEKGDIGIVEKVIDLETNPLLQISFDGTEILLPNREEFILAIDHKKKLVEIDAPPGLIDMYIGERDV